MFNSQYIHGSDGFLLFISEGQVKWYYFKGIIFILLKISIHCIFVSILNILHLTTHL